MGFAGIYSEGFDNEYNFSDMTSEEVADTIPGDLDEIFNISANMAEWEEENEEEENEE
jgi:hypothetical protein